MTITTATPTNLTGRKANLALWAMQAVMSAAFLMAAFTKLIAYPAAVETFDRIGFGSWFIYVIAAVELAGAIGLLLPALCGLAALGLTGLLIGAVITQVLLFDPVFLEALATGADLASAARAAQEGVPPLPAAA